MCCMVFEVQYNHEFSLPIIPTNAKQNIFVTTISICRLNAIYNHKLLQIFDSKSLNYYYHTIELSFMFIGKRICFHQW